jgi:hypothetical protein
MTGQTVVTAVTAVTVYLNDLASNPLPLALTRLGWLGVERPSACQSSFCLEEKQHSPSADIADLELSFCNLTLINSTPRKLRRHFRGRWALSELWLLERVVLPTRPNWTSTRSNTVVAGAVSNVVRWDE